MARTKYPSKSGAQKTPTSSRKQASPQRMPRGVGGETPRRAHRFRSGTKVLKEIRKYQRSTDLLLRKLPFARLVRSREAVERGGAVGGGG